MANVHALLVGINAYPIAHHQLNGCINDVEAIENYLQKRFQDKHDSTLNIKTLKDAEASRQGMIDGFDHFKDAKDGDICLFYFTGHGSQSDSPKEFMHIDIDGMNQSLVCHDSRIEGGRDLMDKELSYLIWNATNGKDVHFLALFDCCHAGNNTKDVGMTARMAEVNLTPTKLEDFLGFDKYKKGGTAEAPAYTPPRGKHIAFAAARSNQTAKETMIKGAKRGIFTYNLIEVLEQLGSNVSYKELNNTLKTRIANRVSGQTPQLDATDPNDKNKLFLDGAVPAVASNYTINFDKKLNMWTIDAGEIQGLPRDQSKNKEIKIIVLDQDFEVAIESVHASFSILTGLDDIDKNKVFKAAVTDVLVQGIKVGIHPDADKEGITHIKKELQKENSKHTYLAPVDEVEEADFLIHAYQGSYRLLLPGDDRPLFKRIEGYSAGSAAQFLDLADQVGQWNKSRELSNPKSGISDNDVAIKLYRLDNPALYFEDTDKASEINWKEESVFRYGYDKDAESEEEKWLYPAFRLSIKNNSRRRYYVSGLYFTANFGITNRYLPMQMLEPGEEAWMLYTPLDEDEDYYETKTLGLNIYDPLLSWGVSEISEYIKIFVSKKEIDTTNFNVPELEMDTMKTNNQKVVGRRPKGNRSDDWRTFDLELKITRPNARVDIPSQQTVTLANSLSIELPKGVSATAAITGSEDIARLETEHTSKSADAAAYHLPEELTNWERQDITDGSPTSTPASVLELSNVEGLAAIDVSNPLKVHLKQPLAENEVLLPLGYDIATGLYYPLGPISTNGQMELETLPDPTPDGQKSLGGSLKIFFQKKVLPFFGYEYTYPQLAIPSFTKVEGEALEKVDYNTDQSTLKAEVEKADKILLFIHGIIGSTVEMAPSVKNILDENGKSAYAHYDLILTFDYENLNTSIADNGKFLGESLASVGLGPNHGKELVIIAHSMGGLVSRYFIENEGGNQVVSRLIQVGTPNAGSAWTSVYELAMTLLTRTIQGASFLQPYLIPLSFLGKLMDELTITLKQMEIGGEFLNGLNDGTDPGIPYSIVIGNTKLISAAFSEQQKTLLQRMLQRFNSRNLYTALDAAVFKAANDIAVSSESIAAIKGKENRQFVPKEYITACDHISYFVDPKGLADLSKAVFEQ